MTDLAILPGLLEEAAADLRTSRAPHDETFEELSYALDLALTALYRFNMSQAPARRRTASAPPRLVLAASR
jgi:hypothetical protein